MKRKKREFFSWIPDWKDIQEKQNTTTGIGPHGREFFSSKKSQRGTSPRAERSEAKTPSPRDRKKPPQGPNRYGNTPEGDSQNITKPTRKFFSDELNMP